MTWDARRKSIGDQWGNAPRKLVIKARLKIDSACPLQLIPSIHQALPNSFQT
jgi:hypothetical protein